jgi:hypothetical protein
MSSRNTAPSPAGKPNNIITGDVKVDLGGGATGSVGAPTETLEKVMQLASSLWRAIQNSGVAAGDDQGNDALMQRLQGEYKDFATSYPIPFRWMVQAREYAPEPFEKYLRTHVKGMYKDRTEFMAAQGEYLVLLYKHRHPRAGPGQMRRYRTAITKSLQEDDDKFTAARGEAEEAVQLLDKSVDVDRRQRMVAYLLRLKAMRAPVGAAGAPTPVGAVGAVLLQGLKDPHCVEVYLSRMRREAAAAGDKPAPLQDGGTREPEAHR